MPTSSTNSPPSPRRTVLLVDDEAALRMLTGEVLEGAGFEVLSAGSGADALAAVADRSAIDLAITDMVMPGMGGREVAEKLRERWPALPILFISGYIGDAGSRGTVGPEYATVLVKPYRVAELLERVEELLSRSTPPPTGSILPTP